MQGKGVLFVNDGKTAGDKRPDYKGNVEIDGTKYDLAAWKNEKDGKRWLSVKITDARTAATAPRADSDHIPDPFA